MRNQKQPATHAGVSAGRPRGAPAARKATFSLRPHVLEAVDAAVASGAAPSKNAFVERALLRELDDLRRDQLRARWAAASRDPLFMRDIAEVEAAFANADAESARAIG